MTTIKIGYTQLVFEYFMQKQDGTIDQAPHSTTYDGGTGTSATGE